VIFVYFLTAGKQRNEPSSVLYVANISYDTTVSGLAAAFSDSTDARIITHADTGKSKG